MKEAIELTEVSILVVNSVSTTFYGFRSPPAGHFSKLNLKYLSGLGKVATVNMPSRQHS